MAEKPGYREKYNENYRLRMREKRKDPEYREHRNELQRNWYRRKKTDPEYHLKTSARARRQRKAAEKAAEKAKLNGSAKP